MRNQIEVLKSLNLKHDVLSIVFEYSLCGKFRPLGSQCTSWAFTDVRFGLSDLNKQEEDYSCVPSASKASIAR